MGNHSTTTSLTSMYNFEIISSLSGFSGNQLTQLIRVVNIKNDTLKQLLANNIFNSKISVNKIKYSIDLCENTEMYLEEANIYADHLKGIYDLVEEYIKDITLNNIVEDDKAEIIGKQVYIDILKEYRIIDLKEYAHFALDTLEELYIASEQKLHVLTPNGLSTTAEEVRAKRLELLKERYNVEKESKEDIEGDESNGYEE